MTASAKEKDKVLCSIIIGDAASFYIQYAELKKRAKRIVNEWRSIQLSQSKELPPGVVLMQGQAQFSPVLCAWIEYEPAPAGITYIPDNGQ